MLHEGAAYPSRPLGAGDRPGGMGGGDPDRATAPALARDHRLAGRLGHAGRRWPRTARSPATDADCASVGALWWDRHRGLGQIDEMSARPRRRRVGNFHPTTVKIMVDGSMENQTGAMLEPYCDGCGGHTAQPRADVRRPRAAAAAVTELDGPVSRCTCTRSATGRSATRSMRWRRRTRRTVRSDNRHHIAHVQVVQPEDVPRFAALGVVANCQTYWAQHEPQMEELTLPFLGGSGADAVPVRRSRRAGARWRWAATGR